MANVASKNLITTLDIKDPERKKALLLRYAGPNAHEIYDTLQSVPVTDPEQSTSEQQYVSRPPTSAPARDAYEKSKAPLYCVRWTYVFRQARQKQGETLDMFQSRLRQHAVTCDFANLDKEIKAQIVSGCLSTRLRHKAMCDPKVTLSDLLDHGKALQTSESGFRN